MSDIYIRDPDEAFHDAIEASVMTEAEAGDYMYMCSVGVSFGVNDQFKHRLTRSYRRHLRHGADPAKDKRYEDVLEAL
jgi:hypothetical protein